MPQNVVSHIGIIVAGHAPPIEGFMLWMLLRNVTIAGLFLAAVLVLSACAAKYENPSADTEELLFAAFLDGRANLDCHVRCSGRWGANRKELKNMHDLSDWHGLAERVTEIGYDNNLAWYYLGRAAEGLGHVDAARTYYSKALASRPCNTSLFNTCNGFVFPDTISFRLAGLESVNKAARAPSGAAPSLEEPPKQSGAKPGDQ